MKIVIAKSQKEILDNVLVRGNVFIIEQGIDWDIEFDGLDQQSVLFTAYIGDTPVGAARLLGNKVGRVATLWKYRNQGVGTALMKEIEKYASEHNIRTLKLHAQSYIKDFYLHLGYSQCGDKFDEAEIEHIPMEKKI